MLYAMMFCTAGLVPEVHDGSDRDTMGPIRWHGPIVEPSRDTDESHASLIEIIPTRVRSLFDASTGGVSDKIGASERDFFLFRIGLAASGAFALHIAAVIAFSAPLSTSPLCVAALMIAAILGMVSLIVAGLGPLYRFTGARWLILSAYVAQVLALALLRPYTTSSPVLVSSDAGLMNELAGELLLRGENPYDWDYSGVFDIYRADRGLSTPLLDGSVTGAQPYPALAFLAAIPFQILGVPGVFGLGIAVHILALILLFVASPRALQPFILVPLAIGINFVDITLIGSLDTLWAVLLMLVVLVWKRGNLRAILFGLACATKQTPWLLIPFLLIRIWKEESQEPPLLRIGRFVLVSGLSVLFVNLPFIIWDLQAWAKNLLVPIQGSLLFLGPGLSSLSQFGLMDLPKGYYLFATVSTGMLLLFVYWRHYSTLRHTYWILPGIMMWFSYRSLASYWVFWTFPILASLATESWWIGIARTGERKSWRTTAIAVTSTVVGLALLAVWTASTAEPQVRVNIFPPLWAEHGRITSMTVGVQNVGQETLEPRFMVRSAYRNPLPWQIDSGPLQLRENETGVYQISSTRHDRTFVGHEDAQLIVTDAKGNYSLMETINIPGEEQFLWPDALANPGYRYWDRTSQMPLFWQLSSTPEGQGTASLQPVEGRDALVLALQPDDEGYGQVSLSNWVPMPREPIGIWIYATPPADKASNVAYGVEIDDGQHRLWTLFGSAPYAAPSMENTHIIFHEVPELTWLRAEIDIEAGFREAGWSIPPYTYVNYRGLDGYMRMVTFRLILVARESKGSLQAAFGPIEQTGYRIPPESLMAETLDEPAQYYMRLAEEHVRNRNYDRALAAYRQALAFMPDETEAEQHLDLLDRITKGLESE
jgi:hypothetical protein